MQGSVNVGRVMIGGLVAGLIMSISQFVLNELVLGESMAAQFEAMNVTPPAGGTIGLFVVMTFVLGIATIWLYAMLRSHSGPGMGTAVCTAIFVWFFYALMCNAFFWALEMIDTRSIVTATVWTGVELVIATIAGAYLYRD